MSLTARCLNRWTIGSTTWLATRADFTGMDSPCPHGRKSSVAAGWASKMLPPSQRRSGTVAHLNSSTSWEQRSWRRPCCSSRAQTS